MNSAIPEDEERLDELTDVVVTGLIGEGRGMTFEMADPRVCARPTRVARGATRRGSHRVRGVLGSPYMGMAPEVGRSVAPGFRLVDRPFRGGEDSRA